MFVPKVFAEENEATLYRAIRDIGVGIVVSHAGRELVATHVPIEAVPPTPEEPGLLRCHFARPNPHARALTEHSDLLVIFQGPQAYVTPNWYATKARTGKVVPTWNYAAVHVYGRGRVYTDQGRLKQHLAALTDQFEAGGEQLWQLSDAPEEFIAQLMSGIVGVEIVVERLEGKWKMSQNRAPEDRRGVVEGLRARGGLLDEAVACLVEQRLEDVDAH